jgi:hypothetical protein
MRAAAILFLLLMALARFGVPLVGVWGALFGEAHFWTLLAEVGVVDGESLLIEEAINFLLICPYRTLATLSDLRPTFSARRFQLIYDR